MISHPRRIHPSHAFGHGAWRCAGCDCLVNSPDAMIRCTGGSAPVVRQPVEPDLEGAVCVELPIQIE